MDSWNGALTRHKIDPTAIPADITDLPNAFCAVARAIRVEERRDGVGMQVAYVLRLHEPVRGLVPNAKFIVIWRDPADVCRSIVRAAEKARGLRNPAWICAQFSAIGG